MVHSFIAVKFFTQPTAMPTSSRLRHVLITDHRELKKKDVGVAYNGTIFISVKTSQLVEKLNGTHKHTDTSLFSFLRKGGHKK
jgi:hypothetical protein